MAKICPTCSTEYPDTDVFCPRDGSGLIASSARDGLIGEVIADMYLVTSLLGQGGMGTVYHAQHVRLPQQVAIKILHANRSSDPSHATRFRQEAEAASRIDHDRVARVYDFGTTASGEAYIAMEYVPGRTLASLLEEGALDAMDAAQIIFMAAEGLDAAHRIGIIHRDLKPENVMIVDDAEGSIRVKVLDFGIAKMVSGPRSATLTQHGFIIGSPSYMSPEQVMGESLDARSDVYSLGILAFMLLTGARPFAGATPEAEMLARLTTGPLKLSQVAPTVSWPAELQDIFDRTFVRELEVRPQRAKIFADEFFNAITSWKGATRPPGMFPSKSISKVPFPATGVNELALAGASAQSSAPAKPVQSNAKKMAMAGVGVAAVVASVVAYQFSNRDNSTVTSSSAGIVANGNAATPTASVIGSSPNQLAAAESTQRNDKPIASGNAEKPAPVTVDLSKTDPRAKAGTAAKPGIAQASVPTPPVAKIKAPSVDSAALAAAAAAVPYTAVKPPAPEAKPIAAEAPVKTSAELSNEAKATIRAYADAIESHDTGKLRAAFPSISSSQLDTWGTFFQYASAVKVSLNSVTFGDQPQSTSGSKLHATVSATINYRNDSKRKDEHDAVKWQAVLSRTASGWQLVELQ